MNILFSLFSTLIIMGFRAAFLFSYTTSRLKGLFRMPAFT